MTCFTKKELKLFREMLGFNPFQIEQLETLWLEGKLSDRAFDNIQKIWKKIGFKVFTKKEMEAVYVKD